MFFSVIIPVYNRPLEVKELLQSLLEQDYREFEVIVVEDGSTVPCRDLVQSFQDKLHVAYFMQSNQGQGFARNYGMTRARGDYFVLFDSDCLVPGHYLKTLKRAIRERKLDAHGGPDAAGEDFTVFQKAVNFSMTSRWTTGGIRGKLKNPEKYQARGYNMGMSKAVFLATGGFVDPNKGEDIELSIRIKKLGYRLELVKEAYVYHKRKNTFRTFLAQSFSFGRNRVNISRYHPGSIAPVHLLPSAFLLGWIGWLVLSLFSVNLFFLGAVVFGAWTLGLFLSSVVENRSVAVGLTSVLTSYGQLLSYGAGLLWEAVLKKIRG